MRRQIHSAGQLASGMAHWMDHPRHRAQRRSVQINQRFAQQGTATRLPYPDGYLDAIITDPPYYDAVPYADLSDFFYVWLKRSVGFLYPELFRTPLTPNQPRSSRNQPSSGRCSRQVVLRTGNDSRLCRGPPRAVCRRHLCRGLRPQVYRRVGDLTQQPSGRRAGGHCLLAATHRKAWPLAGPRKAPLWPPPSSSSAACATPTRTATWTTCARS